VATSRSTSGVADQVGRVLSDRYRLVAPIGTGASATVHLADDVRLGRRVAVKVLHPALAAVEDFLPRFRAEARAAAALSHPNIMAVYDWGEDQGPFLVLELLSGGSLRAMLDTGHRLSVSQALIVGLEAGRALEAAHRTGFVHRDIKPANLLFGEDGRLRIADFGLARALSEAAWTEPSDGLIGTARYAAPEQASGVRVDGKADVYSLALVLIEAVTGAVPRVADSALATVRLRADEPVPVPDELGVLQPILARALQPDPAARPDAAHLVQDLLVAARQLDRPTPLPLVGLGDHTDDATVAFDDDVTVLPPRAVVDPTLHGAPATRAASRRRRWWLVPLVLAVVLAVLGGGYLAWQTVQPASAEVPDVAGKSEDVARAAIQRAQTKDVAWKIVTKEEFSDGVAAGVVISTKPAGGSSLDDNSTLTLVVSKGPEPVPLPSLVDVDEAGAKAALEGAHLKLGNVTHEFSETIPKGSVTGWSVAGTEKPEQVPKGTAVDVRISDGPEPRTIPQLDDAPKADGQAELEKLDLVVKVVEEFSDDVEAGLVTRTDPPSGTKVEKGATVTLYVSKGPDLITVPDVIGMTYSDAYDTLTAAGFVLGDPSGQGNRVVRTNPKPGTKAKRGSEVTVYLKR
jgi:serine/threonine-protein kinase